MLLSYINNFRGKANPKSLWHPDHYDDKNGKSFVHGQCAGYTFMQVPGVNKYVIFTTEPNKTNKPEKYTCVFQHEGDSILKCEAVDNLNGGGVMAVIFEHGKPTTVNFDNPRLKYLILILVGRYASSFDRHTIDTTEASLNKKLVDMCKNKETKPEDIRALIYSNNIIWNYMEAFTVAMNAGSYGCVDVLVEKWPLLKIRIVQENHKSYPKYKEFKEKEEEMGGLS